MSDWNNVDNGNNGRNIEDINLDLRLHLQYPTFFEGYPQDSRVCEWVCARSKPPTTEPPFISKRGIVRVVYFHSYTRGTGHARGIWAVPDQDLSFWPWLLTDNGILIMKVAASTAVLLWWWRIGFSFWTSLVSSSCFWLIDMGRPIGQLIELWFSLSKKLSRSLMASLHRIPTSPKSRQDIDVD